MNAPTADAEYSTLNGRYRIEAAIGRGGMATVYRSRDEGLGREVAVKLFDAKSHSEEIALRRDGELKVLAALNHHGLVTMFDAGVHTDGLGEAHHYLVMELVEGMDLQRRLSGSELSVRHIGEIGYDIAEALDYVHARGVVHRDIKPSNILLVDYQDNAPRARAKLTDFGIALWDDAAARITKEGATTGTAGYLSPEQAASEEITGATDVYSLGLVLLECFTRQMAFPGTQVQSAVARLLHAPAIPDSLPDGWKQLLGAMTARNPADRPAVRELVSALRQLVIDESGRHKDSEPDPIATAASAATARRQAILETGPDDVFDRITALAARTLSVPVAFVSLFDTEKVWVSAPDDLGFDVDSIGQDPGLFASTLYADGPLVIEDARRDPRTQENQLVTGEIGLSFYAGVPLTTFDGHNLGTLCVVDFEPRTVTDDDRATLADLAAIAINELESRLRTGEVDVSAAS